MAWRIEFTESATKALGKIDRQAARRIVRFLRERVAPLPDPRQLAKGLQGELRQYWRFRVGVYRVVCTIEDETVRIVVVRVGHRKDVYK